MSDDVERLLANTLNSAFGTHTHYCKVGGKLLLVSTNSHLPVTRAVFHSIVTGTVQLRGDEQQASVALLRQAFPKAHIFQYGETILNSAALLNAAKASLIPKLNEAILSQRDEGLVLCSTPPDPTAQTDGKDVTTPYITPNHARHSNCSGVIIQNNTVTFRIQYWLKRFKNWLFSEIGKLIAFVVILVIVMLPVCLAIYTKYVATQQVHVQQQQAKEHLEHAINQRVEGK